jgi:Cdc6-like AAA superfamily ATPase
MKPTQPDWEALSYEASVLFSPSAPVDEKDLFAGRRSEIKKLIETVTERGKHAILYGERGVGKTSLANVIRYLFPSIVKDIHVIKEQVDPLDTFSSLWRKVFKDINVDVRLNGNDVTVQIADFYESEITPDDVRRELERSFIASQLTIIVIDEFDKAKDPTLGAYTAHLIKILSDYSVNVTVVVVGVADDISELIKQHESIPRSIEQMLMPRMSNDEMREILEKRVSRMGISIHPDARWKIISLSRGLPSYVHLLGMYSVQEAAHNKTKNIVETHVDAAIKRAIERSQESIQREYAAAVHTNRSDTLFREVIVACALAKTDELGMFSPNKGLYLESLTKM